MSYQEENKILDKMHRQKVSEVEKLTQTVRELEEAVLAGGAAANAVREYQRKVQEINVMTTHYLSHHMLLLCITCCVANCIAFEQEEKRILDRELARAKISANRVAVVVANDWKDASDKVMPVKQWLEERKFYQGEMQQLKDKLAIAERAAKAEAQLKVKILMNDDPTPSAAIVCNIFLIFVFFHIPPGEIPVTLQSLGGKT